MFFKMHTFVRNAYSRKAILLSFVGLCLSCPNLYAAQAQNSWRNAFEVVANGSYLADADSQKLGVLYSTVFDARKVFVVNIGF